MAIALHRMTQHDDDMRTIIELPDPQLAALDAWRDARGLSRAEAVRRAVALLLDDARARRAEVDAAFGLWRDLPIDRLHEQRRLRDEWGDR